MAKTANENLVHAEFFMHTQQDEAETKKQGRPIFTEHEAIRIRFAANKQTVHVAPAHEVFKTEKDFRSGEVTPLTYAMVYNEQYRKFKAGAVQTAAGTPLEELPFLTQAKRLELKALSIFTAEALASLDGQPLKQLGMGGRELKNQAQAYLDNAKGSVDVVKMAATIAALTEQVARLTGKSESAVVDETQTAPANTSSPFSDWDAEDIKNWIKANGGAVPRGNAGHATLVNAADEINAALAVKAKEKVAA